MKKYNVFCRTSSIYAVITGIFAVFGVYMHTVLPEVRILKKILYYGGEIFIFQFGFGGFAAPLIFALIAVIFAAATKNKKALISKQSVTAFALLLVSDLLGFWFMSFGA